MNGIKQDYKITVLCRTELTRFILYYITFAKYTLNVFSYSACLTLKQTVIILQESLPDDGGNVG